MISFGRALVRVVVAGSLVATGAVAVEAAGALAVGSCGAYGFAYDYRQPEPGPPAALGKCRGGACRVATAMKRACAALAIDVTNACGALGYASAGRLGQAQNTALRQCYRYGGKDCVIRAFVCDAKG